MISRLVSVPDMSQSVQMVLQVVMSWTYDRSCLIAPRNLDLSHRLSLSFPTPVNPQSCKRNRSCSYQPSLYMRWSSLRWLNWTC